MPIETARARKTTHDMQLNHHSISNNTTVVSTDIYLFIRKNGRLCETFASEEHS